MIAQCRFSNSVKFFEQGFLKKWSVRLYNDKHAPCLFVGVYRPEDVKIINEHKGLKFIWNTGKMRDLFKTINPENTITTGFVNELPERYKTSTLRFPIKDFSDFKPVPLGSKIYCYLNNEAGKFINGWETIQSLRKLVKFDFIIGYQGHDMKTVQDNFYTNSFVNIKPSLTGGFTTAIEMAYMGRRTLSPAKAAFCTNYNTIQELAHLVHVESKKIGTVQDSMIGDYFTNKDWKTEESWKS